MAVPFNDNLDYWGKLPDFTRQQFATIAEMVAVKSGKMPEMYLVYCLEDRRLYTYDKSRTDDPTFGKFRPLAVGETIQVTALPIPSVYYLGKCLQYLGETTVDYNHGYFYDCVEFGPGVYIWSSLSTGPATVNSITAADINALFS